MSNVKYYVISVFVAISVLGCGGSPSPGGNSASNLASGGNTPQPEGHGEETPLGEIALLDHGFSLTRLGKAEPGKECGFQASKVKGSADLASLNAYLWIEDAAGVALCSPDKAKIENQQLHFHATPKAGSQPKYAVFRLRLGDKDERAKLPLDGHGHSHDETPHGGVVAKILDAQNQVSGYLELKLHDDKGDLELWLCKDQDMKQPIDLPLDTKVEVTFIDKGSRKASLEVRNREKNEDVDGVANIRQDKTHYFIFPGQTGQDSQWLMGADFASLAVIRFQLDGKNLVSEEFVLKPHQH